jgi:hypothetical protein
LTDDIAGHTIVPYGLRIIDVLIERVAGIEGLSVADVSFDSFAYCLVSARVCTSQPILTDTLKPAGVAT